MQTAVSPRNPDVKGDVNGGYPDWLERQSRGKRDAQGRNYAKTVSFDLQSDVAKKRYSGQPEQQNPSRPNYPLTRSLCSRTSRTPVFQVTHCLFWFLRRSLMPRRKGQMDVTGP